MAAPTSPLRSPFRAPLYAPAAGKWSSAYAGTPAPAGYRWEFVTDDSDGSLVMDEATGQPVVDLVSNT